MRRSKKWEKNGWRKVQTALRAREPAGGQWNETENTIANAATNIRTHACHKFTVNATQIRAHYNHFRCIADTHFSHFL